MLQVNKVPVLSEDTDRVIMSYSSQEKIFGRLVWEREREGDLDEKQTSVFNLGTIDIWIRSCFVVGLLIFIVGYLTTSIRLVMTTRCLQTLPAVSLRVKLPMAGNH